MPITLFDTSSQEPIIYDSGTDAKDAILSGQANFDPNQEVYLKDGSGAIVKSRGKDAVGYIADPNGDYSLATDEDVYKQNRKAKFGSTSQQVITGAEGLVNSAALGFGNALTKTAIDLFTPKGSDYAKKYGEAVQERSAENPGASLTGEVAGIFTDPLDAGAALAKGAEKVAAKTVATGTKIATKVAPIAEKIITSPVVQKSAQRAVQFGAEGGAYGASFETGRELTDDKPINGDAILASAKENAILGGAIGLGFGATEAAGAAALKQTKVLTKKYLDKITGAKAEQAGEVFADTPTVSLKKEVPEFLGRKQRAVKLEEAGENGLKYADDRREGIVDLKPDAKGIDLTNPADVKKMGDEFGVDDLDFKLKHMKPADEPLHEFMARQKIDQKIQDAVRRDYPYMSEADQGLADRIQQTKDRVKNLQNVTPEDIQIMDAALNAETKLFKKYNEPSVKVPEPEMNGFDHAGKPVWKEPDTSFADNLKAEYNKARIENVEDALRRAESKLSEYDYIKSVGPDGKPGTYVFNESILPENITVKKLAKGVKPLDFEAGQMSKQYRMTPRQMIKMGNERLNEVAQFILDRYPTEGSMLKRVTTSADHIYEEIHTVKNRAIDDINEAVEQALNLGSTRNRMTSQDIAKYVEHEILPRFTDAKTGNPIAGLDKEFNQIRDFAEGYKNNGFVSDKYGKKNYVPLDVKELREIRIKLDKVAKYNSEQANALQDAARELRTYIEDEVVSRVKNVDPNLVEKYNKAKKNYGLSMDAGKIVDAAAKKAAKESNFSLFYSGVGAGVGASMGGVPGAIIGGLVGGAARQTLREFSGAISVFLSRNLGKNIESYEKLIESTAKAFFKPIEKSARGYMILPKDSDDQIAKKDYLRLVSEIENKQSYMEKFVDDNSDLFAAFPQTSEKILNTTLRAREFLLTKLPKNPYQGNPWKEESWKPSPLEINKYMRYREAVSNPGTILRQIRDGYVTPEAIEVLDQVFPDTKLALTEQFIQNAGKAKTLPVEKRVELFKIFGIQLDSFMSGESFKQLQMDSNGQANETALQNNGGNYKPQNGFKLKERDSTLGNSTLK